MATNVHDAMVRMAQDFSSRLQLARQTGGDNLARWMAIRQRPCVIPKRVWPDCRAPCWRILTKTPSISATDEITVRTTVLPARFPIYALVNGAGGIAVGVATNIPPRTILAKNLLACIAQVRKPRLIWVRLLVCRGRISRQQPGRATSATARAPCRPSRTARTASCWVLSSHLNDRSARPTSRAT